jgi:hypothetical protein
MAIDRSNDADGTAVVFRLTDDDPAGPVSVVGSFNDWTPGAHPFETDADGSRSVTVVVPAGTTTHFRYLAADGYWFDDPQADEVTPEGSVLRTAAPESAPEIAETTDDTATVADSTNDASDVQESAAGERPSEPVDRLDAVAERIDIAKDAARDLVERDVLDPPPVDEHRETTNAAQP